MSTESLLEQPTGSHRVKYMGAGERASHDFTLETDDRPIDVSLVLPHYRAHNQPYDHRLSMYVGSESGSSVKVKVVCVARPAQPSPKSDAASLTPARPPAPSQCRKFTPSRTTNFKLEVHSASGADVTIWLPSDFKGHIHRSSACRKVSFSAGFTNRIMRNVCLTQSRRPSVVSMSDHAAHRFSEIYVSDGRPGDMEKKAAAAAAGAFPLGFAATADGQEDEVVVETAGSVTFRMWDIHRGEPEARCREVCKRAFGLGWCSKRSNEVAIDWDFLLED
ncbi:hypothetical protein PYCCODRAFT_1440946 [Trametes coccinea BRFM310]|uniref:DUF7330 domain-containing protein n=1 Tax=Trametes coccinea (strain BRFM310) TaxID=1353009 RepID=A0A1Y2I659_TRAC3|nr:hypothetical protein PYCCODRAFT_1440946 [Trametes coccinea BRFM310]